MKKVLCETVIASRRRENYGAHPTGELEFIVLVSALLLLGLNFFENWRKKKWKGTQLRVFE